MLKYNRLTDPRFGECLYATNGIVELYIPLSYGIRIAHFSFCGKQNIFWEQPADMTLYTKGDWRIRGGHRMWIAPEDDREYFPDNAPIDCRVENDTIVLTQQEDTLQKVIKGMEITFGEGASVTVRHKLQNTDTAPRECALWPISVMAPGGTEHIPLMIRDVGDHPSHWLSFWDSTNIGDPRVTYLKDEIILTHRPIGDMYKVGVSQLRAPAWYENHGVIFEIEFSVTDGMTYPDNDVSYETYLCDQMLEMESLSPLYTFAPGETREHTEVWHLRNL
jgi:hypothetical protein